MLSRQGSNHPAGQQDPGRPGAPASAGAVRDYRLDFFRGLALILIFIDHVPGNVLGWFTLPTIAFSDAAEIFIFISGYTAAMVYGRVLARKGLVFASARIYRRVWQLYVTHLFIFMVYAATVSFTVQRFSNPMYNDELHVGDFLSMPEVALVKALILQFQPSFLDILPLYIVLLAAFPLMLAALRRNVGVVLLASLLIYAAVQVTGFNLPGYPEGRFWSFDPFAWQLPFTIGAVFGTVHARGGQAAPANRRVRVAALVVVGVLAAIKICWTLHALWDEFPAVGLRWLWPVDKTILEPLRMVSFLALAFLVGRSVSPGAAWLKSRAAWPLVLCGQNSLDVFCAGIFLALVGHFLMVEISDSLPMQLAINAGGILAMVALAYLITWYTHGGRLPDRTDGLSALDERRA